MFSVQATGECGVIFARCSEPFEMSDALETLTALDKGQYAGLSRDMPMLIDVTQVQMWRVPSAEYMRFVMRRRANREAPLTGPVANVCSDMGSFGTLRMFGVASALAGLRAEELHFVTTDFMAAARWILEKVPEACSSPDALLAEISNLR